MRTMTLSKFHTREELETIANYGVDAVSFWQWEATDEWAECFAYQLECERRIT